METVGLNVYKDKFWDQFPWSEIQICVPHEEVKMFRESID